MSTTQSYVFDERTGSFEKREIKLDAPTSKEFDWWDERVTNEIYLSTNRPDWWKFCHIIASLLADGETVLDVGVGDGHTFWQIISVASSLRNYNIKKVSLLEPSETGLRRAIRRCSQLPVSNITSYQSLFSQFSNAWRHQPERIGAPKRFDKLFAGHVNYYLGKHGITDEKKLYLDALDAIADMATTAVIVTVPRESDYYKMVPNPFGEYVHSDLVVEYYRSKGLHVEVTEIPIHFYVDHVNESRHEAIVLWQFFSNTERQPTEAELTDFIAKANQIKDADGNINFRDQILVVTS